MISFFLFCHRLQKKYSMICASQEALKKLRGSWLFPLRKSLSQFAPKTSALMPKITVVNIYLEA